MELNDNKAGMQGLDKDKINKIIEENSVGSKFYQNEKKKEEQIQERIQKMHEHLGSCTKEDKKIALMRADEEAAAFEATRDLSRTIVHVDMDAFYASVEERDAPHLKEKPMAVGGSDMLSTSNYIARRFGVRAAMPGFIAKKLCPELVIVPVNFSKYTEVSHEIRAILLEYDPNMNPMSLDEAYLDLTEYLVRLRSLKDQDEEYEGQIGPRVDAPDNQNQTLVEDVVNEMRTRIFEKTQLTASAGIASNALLAKVASDMNKPNGQFYLPPNRDDIMKFVKTLPIRKVGGIGKVTGKMLQSLGVTTCADIFDKRMEVFLLFSSCMRSFFLRASLGIGSTHFEPSSDRKSISTERTFAAISQPEQIFDKMDELCQSLERDMQKDNSKGLTVTIKYKTADFKLRTRSKTLTHPVGSRAEIFPVAMELIKKEISTNKNLKLRLLGVGMSKLSKIDEKPKKSILGFFKSCELNKRKTMEVIQDKTDENDNQRSLLAEVASTSSHNAEVVKQSKKFVDLDQEIIVDNLNEDVANEDEKAVIEVDQDNEEEVIFPSERDLEEDSTKDVDNSVYNEETIIEEEETCDSHEDVQPIIEFENEPTTDEINEVDTETYKCPSCQVKSFATLELLNVHLDKCATTFTTTDEAHNDDGEMELSVSTHYIVCPVCNATYNAEEMNLTKFNAHVDSCLNRQTIKSIVEKDRRNSTGFSPSRSQQSSKSMRRKSSDSRPNKKIKLDKAQCKISDFFS